MSDFDTADTRPSGIPEKHMAAVQEAGAALTRYGFLWRGDPDYQRLYHYADQYAEDLREHLAIAGYDLEHQPEHDLFRAFRIDAGHHASFSREESEWLLLLVLLRSELAGDMPDAGRAAPEVTSADIVLRYTSFQERVRRKKVEGTKTLRRFNSMRLIRFLGPGSLDVNNPEGRYVLLPILQSILPASDLVRTIDQMEAQAAATQDRERFEESDADEVPPEVLEDDVDAVDELEDEA